MADKFSGVHWMLATPFKENEDLDLASIGNLMEKAYSSGCEGVVALGVTGEAARLTDAERRAVAKEVIANANGLPVTLGTTAAGTAATVAYSREAAELGAAAVMVSAPAMGKPNPDSLFTHYQRVAEAVDVPVVVQDYPQTSGVHMAPPFIARLYQEIPGVQYLKLEDRRRPPR